MERMLRVVKYCYRVARPRIMTQNSKALQKHRRQMHQARVRIHKQTTEYLNKIQDDFLENHKKEMAQRHFNNQCAFRSKIARNSYILYQSLEKQKQRHQDRLQRIQKYVRLQQLKKLNRDRIRKILQYESSNFWLYGQKINTQNFIAERVLPQYIGSTQYYHKLHSQALAYQSLQFDLLHKVSSNQQTMKHKNKLLIPIYKDVLALMRLVKFSDQERINKQHQQIQTKLTNQFKNDKNKLTQELQKNNTQKQTKLSELKKYQTNLQTKKQYLKSKLRDLIILLKKWKEYTDILAMTSNQVMIAIAQQKNEQSINLRKKVLEKQIAKQRDTTFVNPVQEDTQDQQISLTSYLSKNKETDQLKNLMGSPSSSNNVNQLDNLLKQQQSLVNQLTQQIKNKQLKMSKQQQPNVKLSKEQLNNVALNQDMNIDEGYLEKTETTTSIQVMKEEFKDDQNMTNLLNIAGELTLDYPKLFRKIWDNQIL